MKMKRPLGAVFDIRDIPHYFGEGIRSSPRYQKATSVNL